ncbi:hypothetical protein [Gelidibacter sp. F63206]|uniref:hypothetical protein n=1 Tax=Gelidibacter sp. F63206 TaxID=2926425 RepID=UPI001FF55E08|nr:hypothetical protein [Gelidibacter sp. F63206]MCK0114369.1 hypothetical protein [Gelidibacter sp. F63206]
MAWFNFLKAEGYFNPNQNPEPLRVKDGFQIPYWEILDYLEKLSVEISQGKETELVDELLAVIKNVSENPRDNYRTWYVFTKILGNIPNESIPKEILHFIPVWLNSKFDTMLQTTELCEKLLPKFLNDKPTEADIEKAEIILHYLFQVEKVDVEGVDFFGEGSNYRSRLYLYFLANQFEKTDIIAKVVKYCSESIILELGRTIKFLLLDVFGGVNTTMKDGNKEYEIKIHIEEENLSVSSKLNDSEANSVTSTLPNWEEKSEGTIKNELVSILKKHDIDYTPTNDNDDIFQRLNFTLSTGFSFALDYNSIRKLGSQHYDKEKVLNVFALIFRDLLNEKAKQTPEEALSILKTICFDAKYRVPFFICVSLYVISENWETTKSLFFELIKDNDALYLFSDYKYYKELYDLLKRNQNALNTNEARIIESIIEQGEQNKSEEKTEDDKEYWKLKWFSSLKSVKPFKDKYLFLSNKLKLTSEHFENSGEIKVRTGYVSPISINDLLEKSNQEIVEYIKTFNPKRSFDKPSIGGLSETFGNAVETEPEKFVSEIELYQDIPYIYSYRMLNAFGKAWKEEKTFDWEKVLQFCLNTLKSPKFYGGELEIENDDWSATSDWVVGSIANILTDGLRNDKNSFDLEFLPLAKEIIQIIVGNLKPVDDLKKTNMDYPTYSLNSTAGKSLRALFDYSLHRARNLYEHKDKGKWEKDIKLLFEESLKKGIIDGYILQGMYFEQFCFLDYDWITKQVKQYYTSKDREWLAFMGGFVFGNPPYSKELYNLFYPHYERMIDDNVKFKSFNQNGLVYHLTAFYFREYETLSSEKLLFKFINQVSPDQVGELIHFVWRQKKHFSKTELHRFEQIIIDLWEFLTDKYESTSIEEEQTNLGMLSNWIVFVPELNDTYTNLILKSCKLIDKIYSTHELLENLVALKGKGNPKTTAESIGKIISSLNFKDYMRDSDKDSIKDLVSFLFAYGQNEIASEFCNKMASEHQQFFLREIYEQNTQ